MSLEENLKQLKPKLKNITEELVLKTLAELLGEEEFSAAPKDEEALLDMATYALNRLPAKYVATSKGEVFSKTKELEQQHSVDLLSVLTRSIKVVAENNHNYK